MTFLLLWFTVDIKQLFVYHYNIKLNRCHQKQIGDHFANFKWASLYREFSSNFLYCFQLKISVHLIVVVEMFAAHALTTSIAGLWKHKKINFQIKWINIDLHGIADLVTSVDPQQFHFLADFTQFWQQFPCSISVLYLFCSFKSEESYFPCKEPKMSMHQNYDLIVF